MDHLVFYEDEFEDIKDSQTLVQLLDSLHEDFELQDLSEVYGFYEDRENYEFCQVLLKWENDNIQQNS